MIIKGHFPEPWIKRKYNHPALKKLKMIMLKVTVRKCSWKQSRESRSWKCWEWRRWRETGRGRNRRWDCVCCCPILTKVLLIKWCYFLLACNYPNKKCLCMKITLLFSERTTKHTISTAAKHPFRGKELRIILKRCFDGRQVNIYIFFFFKF